MVSAEAVWSALAEVEDPEIPVISLVDLGVIRDVKIADGRVHVEFTPTFLGCPALEVMRDQMAAKIEAARRGGGRRGRDGRLVVDRPDHARGPREAPRSRLRAAGPARGDRAEAGPAASTVFRCPYCGSTETKLENIFGPTPCRSIRYCSSCRQPFEQFKTI